MALIAVSTEDPGVARIFFDLRTGEPPRQQQSRIASAIEDALATTEASSGNELLPDATVS
jgi:hypothetical protein